MGQLKGDLLVKNTKLVNVLTGLIEENIDIITFGEFIAFVGDASNHPSPDTVIDGDGRYLIPGLIDSHMHVESSMIDLPSFAAGHTAPWDDNHLS